MQISFIMRFLFRLRRIVFINSLIKARAINWKRKKLFWTGISLLYFFSSDLPLVQFCSFLFVIQAFDLVAGIALANGSIFFNKVENVDLSFILYSFHQIHELTDVSKRKEKRGRECEDTDGEQEMEERSHTTTHTESTYLASLQISILLWRGRPPHQHNKKLQPLLWLLTRVLVLQHEHH